MASRRRPNDWVNWRLYRRGWIPALIALIGVLATSFAPATPPQPSLPPTFGNGDASKLVVAARSFDRTFPDRRPGSAGANDSAQWVRSRFEDLGLKTHTAPDTAQSPRTNQPVSLVNVEASLPGRTRETVVLFAHRDNGGRSRIGGDPLGTVALLRVAEDLAATRDRRRSYLFVSTDGATLNAGGARALASRLVSGSAPVVAVIGLDRIGTGSSPLHVPASPSWTYAPPIGLVRAARDAARSEGGVASPPPIASQMLRLAAPITLYEQGQLLRRGLPAVTFTTASERAGRGIVATELHVRATGASLRALQRLLGTLDGIDTVQSAGKTYVTTDGRTYRGWALKILIAAMLLPFWLTAVDYLVRVRRTWNIVAAFGPVARAMLGGIWAIAMLWLVGAAGLLPQAGDVPPNPALVDQPWVAGVLVWLLLATPGWLLARAPDWRRVEGRAGRDYGVQAVAFIALGLLAAAALATSPYTVLFVVPTLHAWLLLASRRVSTRRDVALVVAAGAIGPLACGMAVGAAFDTGLRTPWYWLVLVETRTLPPGLALLAACGLAVAVVLVLASLGLLPQAWLPRIRMALAQGAAAGRGQATLPRVVALRAIEAPTRRSARTMLSDRRALARRRSDARGRATSRARERAQVQDRSTPSDRRPRT